MSIEVLYRNDGAIVHGNTYGTYTAAHEASDLAYYQDFSHHEERKDVCRSCRRRAKAGEPLSPDGSVRWPTSRMAAILYGRKGHFGLILA
jgi:hypothetical protein